MARPILMPQVGQDLTEGKIVAINVKLGDKVKKGDIVAEVESEKATFEVEAFETGTVIEMRYAVGDIATVLQPIMMVGDENEVASVAPKAAKAKAEVKTAMPAEAAPTPQINGAAGSSPLARKLASEAGVDIRKITGTGPGGAVVMKDVTAHKGSASIATFQTSNTGVRSLRPGTGDPLVFIHGFGADLSAWRPFILHLALDNPILALDLPAHGSNADVAVDSFDALTAAVHSAIKAAGINRLHLAGHSVGAAVAANLTGHGGLDVRSLTMISPAGLGPQINGDYIEGFLSANTEAVLKIWLEVLVHKPASLPGALLRATLTARDGTAMIANQKKVSVGLFAGNTQLFSIKDALDKFTGPIRAIIGSDDRIVPPTHITAAPPHVGIHHLPQVGHLPQLEAAELTAKLVAETVRSAG